MMSNTNYENHKDEVELLKNILFDQMTILEESPNFILEISLVPDVIEDPKLNFVIQFTLNDEYPDQSPIYEVTDVSNYLASSKIKNLCEDIKKFTEENLGMPMIYQIYELIKDFANEQENLMFQEIENEKTLEEEKAKKYNQKLLMESTLIETRTFTPVTKENFEEWFKKFYAEANKGKEKKREQEARTSGREYFMNSKNMKGDEEFEVDGDDLEYKEEDSKAKQTETKETIYFDEGAFEENLDDIDFDDDGIDDI